MKQVTKETILTDLRLLIEQLINNEGFNLEDSYHQVTDKGEAINRAYGQFEAYLALWYNITGEQFKEDKHDLKGVYSIVLKNYPTLQKLLNTDF